MVQVQSARLILREFVEDDWQALHAFESLPEVARYQTFDPRTPEESRTYVQELCAAAQLSEARESFEMAITRADNGRLIGRVGLGLSPEEPGQGVLWYTLHPDSWGQGLMTEAASRLLAFGFQQLELHRIWADSDPRNIGSWRVLEKVGMRREGHLRESMWLKGEWVDSYMYALLDREWAATAGT